MTASFLHFTEIHDRKFPHFKTFLILGANLTPLGHIRWYRPHRRYSFYPADNTVWDRHCLQEVINFIDNLMRERYLRHKPQSTEARPPNTVSPPTYLHWSHVRPREHS
jgi:hypothetical protein